MKSGTDNIAGEATMYVDPVIEAYKKDVDRTLLRHNLKLSVQERVDAMIETLGFIEEMNRAGKAARDAGVEQNRGVGGVL